MYYYQKDLPSTSTTSGTRVNYKPQERETSVLHYSGPDGRRFWHGVNSMRSHETKDRAIQEYLETHSKYNMLVQLEARSRERPAILPDTVTCTRALQHTACSLH